MRASASTTMPPADTPHDVGVLVAADDHRQDTWDGLLDPSRMLRRDHGSPGRRRVAHHVDVVHPGPPVRDHDHQTADVEQVVVGRWSPYQAGTLNRSVSADRPLRPPGVCQRHPRTWSQETLDALGRDWGSPWHGISRRGHHRLSTVGHLAGTDGPGARQSAR